jgi:peroxiredoxin Q/BCP
MSLHRSIVPMTILALAAVTGCAGQEEENTEVAKSPKLQVGAPAPSFELPGSDGNTYRLEDFRDSRAVVVAWFPKAFTGG